MGSDFKYPGLCSKITEDSYNEKPSTSLLRIIYSVAGEIDPLRNNFHFIKDNETQRHKLQKIRHVYNNSYAMKRDGNFWDGPPNTSRKNDGFFQHKERGHSRLYHGHDHTHQFDYLHANQNTKNYRRFDVTAPSTEEYINQDYRRKQNSQCTRKYGTTCLVENSKQSCLSVNAPVKRCTRGERNNCNQENQGCQSVLQTSCGNTLPPCPCSTSKVTCATYPNQCIQNYNNCQCSHGQPANLCSEMRRNLNVQNYEMTTEIYDDANVYKHTKFPYQSTVLKTQSFLNFDDETWKLNDRHSNQNPFQKKKNLLHFSDRKRRETENPMTFKPFWQVDEFNKQHQLKSMQFTTLSNKKTRKRKQTLSTTQKSKLVTEPITITMANKVRLSTERYLSFEELLHLRKLNASGYNARRSDDATTAPPASETTESTEYTANTPFVRLKHCTRKLTCTWTAASAGENEGNADIGNRGSRTPPGYVEGCTRTSTCTRDYMNRNKMDTLPTPSTEAEIEDSNDEDYCEKRSLDLRKKDLNNGEVSIKFAAPSTKIKRDHTEEATRYRNNHNEADDSNFELCRCNSDIEDDADYLRKKRESYNRKRFSHDRKKHFKRDTSPTTISYGELFYLVLRKILGKWYSSKKIMESKCICNSGWHSQSSLGLIFVLRLFI